MKACGNHFRVDDPKNRFLQTYDSGIASMFEQQIVDAREVSIQYVGIVKDILKRTIAQWKFLLWFSNVSG